MNFKTFFLILCIIAITFCISTLLIPDILQQIIYTINSNYKINTTFLALLSLTIAIFSFLGLLLSSYFGSKTETDKRAKRNRDRHNVEIIQAEIQALHKDAK